jgi:hypothetical protein
MMKNFPAQLHKRLNGEQLIWPYPWSKSSSESENEVGGDFGSRAESVDSTARDAHVL